jgi:hypothetical protein
MSIASSSLVSRRRGAGIADALDADRLCLAGVRSGQFWKHERLHHWLQLDSDGHGVTYPYESLGKSASVHAIGCSISVVVA